jgi:hypothetical protein
MDLIQGKRQLPARESKGEVDTMKTVLCGFLLLLTSANVDAKEPVNDAAAIQILDHMTAVIGELESCSFTLTVSHDLIDPDRGFVTRFRVDDVHMVGPNKMRIDSWLDDGHRGYWYNGRTFTYYSYDENNYAIVKAPETILLMLDEIDRAYGVDLAAADFFYPTFTDDLIDNSDEIRFLGTRLVDGRHCFHILAATANSRIQLWIADDAMNLPVKYSIVQFGKENSPLRYEGTFSNWKVNPDLPSAMFEVNPPVSATEVTLMPKTGK